MNGIQQELKHGKQSSNFLLNNLIDFIDLTVMNVTSRKTEKNRNR